MEYLVFLGFFVIMLLGNIVCFRMGASIRQKVDNKQEIKTLPDNPIKVYQEKKVEEATKEELDKLTAILNNIDNYDGTDRHQEDIPR